MKSHAVNKVIDAHLETMSEDDRATVDKLAWQLSLTLPEVAIKGGRELLYKMRLFLLKQKELI